MLGLLYALITLHTDVGYFASVTTNLPPRYLFQEHGSKLSQYHALQ